VSDKQFRVDVINAGFCKSWRASASGRLALNPPPAVSAGRVLRVRDSAVILDFLGVERRSEFLGGL
jgi:hypothetical protein